MQPDGITITFNERSGSFQPWWQQLRVTVHDWQGAATARLQDHPLAVSVNAKQDSATLLLDDQAHAAQLVIRRAR